MLKSYIIIAIRNLIRQRLYSFINIFGLAFGITCVLLISLYVSDEVSYDKFHQNATDIYRVEWWSDNPQTRTPHPMALALVQDFPEVAAATTLSPIWGPGLTKQTFSVRNLERDIVYDEKNILSVDSTFFDVFSFKLIKGNRQKVLRNVGGMLISESTAKRYFGEDDPIGKSLAINDDQVMLEVEGVFEDVPSNSHFHFDILVSYVTLKANDPTDAYYTWEDFGHFNYIKLEAGSDAQHLENQLLDWVASYIEISEEDLQIAIANNVQFKLQPITEIHLNSDIRWELEANGNSEYVYIMTGAALLILLIACLNFMNLTTARSLERTKEIGVRKSLGAFRSQLSLQFLGESVITSIIALLIAGFMAEVLLPVFNATTGKALEINYLQQPIVVLVLLGSGLCSGLLSGLYPALFLSSADPISSLKRKDKIAPKGVQLRKGLVVFQFVISMVLIAGSLVIYNQIKFLQNKSLGFDNEAVVVIPVNNLELLPKFEAIKSELLRINGVTSVSAASNIPGEQFNQNTLFATNNPQNRISASEVYVDYDIFDALGIEIVAGRSFSKDYPNDANNAFILNQTAVKNIGQENVLGSEITWEWDGGSGPLKGTVVGIVKDFNFQSLHQPVRPLLFKLSTGFNHIIIKLKDGDYQQQIAAISNVYKSFESNFDFEYKFLSEDLENQYANEQKTGQVFSGFALIAVAIACIGLFALATLSYSQRAKEISIRKVLGAKTSSLLRLLLVSYMKLIALSILIGLPLAWLLSQNWLQNFAYHITLGPRHFIISGLILITITWATLGYLTLKTARLNPVDTLKDE